MVECESARLQELEDVRCVLAVPEGKRFIARLIDHTMLLGQSYAPGDPYATAYNEGLRRVGLFVAGECQAAQPGALAKLFTEDGTNGHN